MPASSKRMFASWSNYNLTVGEPRGDIGALGMEIEHLFSLHCSDVDPAEPLATAAATAKVLCRYVAGLHDIAKEKGKQNGDEGDFAAATVGQGWSFAALTGTKVAQLLAEGLSWSSAALAGSVSKRFKGDPDCLMMAGGGTRLRELVNVAEPLGLSLETGGSHLGQSLAGSCGTGTHGSRLGSGGLQNMVRAMHIVTGPESHVWLQPAHSPVLEQADMARLAILVPEDDGHGNKRIPCELITDDEHFANALIHLGAMGIVNAMVIEMRPIEYFDVWAIDRGISEDWLERLDRGDFAGIGRELGLGDRDLQFYELTLNPHAITGPSAAHVVYTLGTRLPYPARTAGSRPVVGEALSKLAHFPDQFAKGMEGFGPLTRDPDQAHDQSDLGPIDPWIDFILTSLFRDTEATSAYHHYLRRGGFRTVEDTFDPENDATRQGSWGAIHGDEISGGVPGALYNASFAIDRAETSTAVKALEVIGREHERSFVFTLRFVSKAAGTLNFTRFEESTVIEIDGLSRLAMDITRHRMARTIGPLDVHLEAAFSMLSTTLERGAMSVREALEAAGVGYSMHWAKLGNLDGAKVLNDYGTDAIARWRKTREHLLGPRERILFRNPAVEKYGLVKSAKAGAT